MKMSKDDPETVHTLKQIRAYVRDLPCTCSRPKRACARCNAEQLTASLLRECGATPVINVKKEPDDLGMPHENCCFCRVPTPYWTTDSEGNVTGDSVACCQKCARAAQPKDLPTKKQWFQREQIVRRSLGK